jgi:hypothetical protein
MILANIILYPKLGTTKHILQDTLAGDDLAHTLFLACTVEDA